MIYFLLKYIALFMVKFFYRRIRVHNKDRVPTEGPVILVANHPNTLMDPLLVALMSGRNPHALGKSTLFSSPLNRWFFNAIHVLPVYRKQDAVKEMGKNAEIFEKCYQSLEGGNVLIIMPEGISQMDGTLHEIKTGSARIALGAEQRNNFELGLKIVPAGINYSAPTQFFKDVQCRFGRQIDLSQFRALYETDEYEAVYQVTSLIRDALEKLTTTVEQAETAQVLSNLKKIYKQELAVDMGVHDQLDQHDFEMTRGMADAINWYYKHYPDAYHSMDTQMRAYLAKIEGLELRDDLLSTARGQRTFARRALGLAGVILGFPLYSWGLINNYIPYRIPQWVVKILKPTVEYLSTFKMISGFLSFSALYTLQGLLVWWLTQSGGWTTAYLISLLPAARFALYYHDTMRRYRQHLRILTLFIKRKTLMYEIIQERLALITALDEAKLKYMNRAEEEPGSKVGVDDDEA